MTPRTLLEVVEGFYTGHAVWSLHRIGALDRLKPGADVHELGRLLGCDERLLAAVVDYVFHTTDLLTREDGRYSLSTPYREDGRLAFQLEKFLGAYGACIERMAEVLGDPDRGPALRNEAALARAFRELDIRRPSLTRQVLEAWEVTSLADLGCGTAALLIELAEANPEFRGWGVDASATMVETAAHNIRRAGLEQRVEVVRSDVRALGDAVPVFGADVEALYGRSLLNEFFADGGAAATEVLRVLRRRFPRRLFFVEDYYGCLTRDVEEVDGRRHTLLQDLAQAMSGQGVPPADLAGWQSVYESAGCSLVKAYEGTNEGIAWFIHVLQL